MLGAAFAPLMAEAAPAGKKPWPKRDFLPPVANINPKIDPKQVARNAEDKEVEEVSFPAVSTQTTIRLKPKVERLTGVITNQSQSEQLQTVMDIQKKIDEIDLEYLWQATVEKNPVIRFSLEKLATPADLQSKQSSKFLSKTLSTLISGATMATTMLPGSGGMYQNMGAMAVGNALQNMVTGRVKPTTSGLSDTEQIQLAGLIDELKMKLIRSYQDYKHTLENTAQSHEVTVKNNALYSKALASKNDLAIMATGAAYYQSLMNETALRQKAKLYRLELERLAGPEAVSRLELAAHVDTTTQTANNEPVLNKPLAQPLEINQDELPYSVPEPIIGPQPLIGPEPKKPRSMAMPKDLPETMELAPGFKAERQVPLPIGNIQKARQPRKALAEKEPTALEPIEVLHP